MPGPGFYIQDLLMSSLEVRSGQSLTGTIVLESAASDEGVILLTTDTLGANVPESVAIVPPETFVTFTLTTEGLRPNSKIKISAHYYGQTHTVEILVLPASLGGIYFDAPSVVGGNSADLTIELDADSNAGTVLVELSQSTPLGSYSPLIVDLPPTVELAGVLNDTITVTFREVSRALYCSVTATYQDQTATTSILVTPS